MIKKSIFSRIARLASGVSPPPDVECEAGELVPYDPTTTDDIGDEIDVPRRRGESCRAYRFRMQLFLQEELLRKEKYEVLLARLLEAEKRA